MSKIKHQQTVIQTTFALELSDDEQIAQQPITISVSKFSPDAFVEAYEKIKEARDQAIVGMEAQDESAAPATPGPNRAQRRGTAKSRAKRQ